MWRVTAARRKVCFATAAGGRCGPASVGSCGPGPVKFRGEQLGAQARVAGHRLDSPLFGFLRASQLAERKRQRGGRVGLQEDRTRSCRGGMGGAPLRGGPPRGRPAAARPMP